MEKLPIHAAASRDAYAFIGRPGLAAISFETRAEAAHPAPGPDTEWLPDVEWTPSIAVLTGTYDSAPGLPGLTPPVLGLLA
jgi:hypothetical protein